MKTINFLVLICLITSLNCSAPLEDCFSVKIPNKAIVSAGEHIFDIATVKDIIDGNILVTGCYKIQLKNFWQNLMAFKIDEIIAIKITASGELVVSKLIPETDSSTPVSVPIEKLETKEE